MTQNDLFCITIDIYTPTQASNNHNIWYKANIIWFSREDFLLQFSHQLQKDIPLRLLNLNKNGLTVERESSIKFLGVWIDGNLTWRDPAENKIAKNIGLLYQGKHYLDDNCLKQIYFAYINAYQIMQT